MSSIASDNQLRVSPNATESMEAPTAAWSEAKLPMQHWVINAEGLRTGDFDARR
jgi:hypothetical protein